MNNKPADRLTLSVNEVCDMTGLGRTFIYEMIRSGELPSISIGRRRLILRSDLDEFLNKKRTHDTIDGNI